jgi:hypothetical protein
MGGKHRGDRKKGNAAESSHQGLVLAPNPNLSTKQQKRDAKRAAQAAAPASAPGAVGAEGVPGGKGRNKGGGKIVSGRPAAHMPPPVAMPSAYKRPNDHPTPYYSSPETAIKLPNFLDPSSANYADVMSKCYTGFKIEQMSEYLPEFSEQFDASLRGLESNTRFLKYDVTQPGGLNTKIARTYVTRCVVGEAGITYKYLGLRIFGYPWTEGETGATAETIQIGKLNSVLIDHTSKLLLAHVTPEKPYYGSCQYNLTLINRCFPTGVVELKKEPMFEKDNCTVSWHADSSLEHFSSIGVYHVSMQPEGSDPCSLASAHAYVNANAGNANAGNANAGNANAGNAGAAASADATASASAIEDDGGWRASLRVRHDSEGPGAGKFTHAPKAAAGAAPGCPAPGQSEEEKHPEIYMTPPVAVPLPRQCCYHMLDDFNHHQQHSILVGETHRFASTHRVCRRDGHTYASIQGRCKSVLQGSGCDVKQIRAEQSILNDLEFEWIRQYYVQGRQHMEVNVWWAEPMRQLLEYWAQLEERTLSSLQALQEAAFSILGNAMSDSIDEEGGLSKKKMSKIKRKAEKVTLESFDVMLEYLTGREEKRNGWIQRCKEKLYAKQPVEEQPLTPPFAFNRHAADVTPESVSTRIIVSNSSSTNDSDSGSTSGSDKQRYSSPLPMSLGVYIEAMSACRDAFAARTTE